MEVPNLLREMEIEFTRPLSGRNEDATIASPERRGQVHNVQSSDITLSLSPRGAAVRQSFAETGEMPKESVNEYDDGCLICMDDFTVHRKAYPVPCNGSCVGALVHYRCIMAWLAQSGNCPLCRGPCDPLVIQPTVALEVENLTELAMRQVPLDVGIVRCYVKQVKRGLFKQYGYELYMQPPIQSDAPDRLLLVAKKQIRSNLTTNYAIWTHASCNDEHKVGRMGANLVGTRFTLYDNGQDPKKVQTMIDKGNNVLQIREELGCITYEPNRTSVGPRKMRVCLPEVSEEDGNRKIVRPMSGSDRLVTRLANVSLDGLKVYTNREPVYREDIGAYCLDFGGRVSMASVKNFQLISEEDPSMGNVLQFGRVGADLFTMDFQWPLSPFQAFAISLSSCDTKLACV